MSPSEKNQVQQTVTTCDFMKMHAFLELRLFVPPSGKPWWALADSYKKLELGCTRQMKCDNRIWAPHLPSSFPWKGSVQTFFQKTRFWEFRKYKLIFWAGFFRTESFREWSLDSGFKVISAAIRESRDILIRFSGHFWNHSKTIFFHCQKIRQKISLPENFFKIKFPTNQSKSKLLKNNFNLIKSVGWKKKFLIGFCFWEKKFKISFYFFFPSRSFDSKI